MALGVMSTSAAGQQPCSGDHIRPEWGTFAVPERTTQTGIVKDCPTPDLPPAPPPARSSLTSGVRLSLTKAVVIDSFMR